MFQSIFRPIHLIVPTVVGHGMDHGMVRSFFLCSCHLGMVYINPLKWGAYLTKAAVGDAHFFCSTRFEPLARVAAPQWRIFFCSVFFGAAFLTVSLQIHNSKIKTARRIKTAKRNKRVIRASDPEPLHERVLKCPSYRSLGDVGVWLVRLYRSRCLWLDNAVGYCCALHVSIQCQPIE